VFEVNHLWSTLFPVLAAIFENHSLNNMEADLVDVVRATDDEEQKRHRNATENDTTTPTTGATNNAHIIVSFGGT